MKTLPPHVIAISQSVDRLPSMSRAELLNTRRRLRERGMRSDLSPSERAVLDLVEADLTGRDEVELTELLVVAATALRAERGGVKMPKPTRCERIPLPPTHNDRVRRLLEAWRVRLDPGVANALERTLVRGHPLTSAEWARLSPTQQRTFRHERLRLHEDRLDGES